MGHPLKHLTYNVARHEHRYLARYRDCSACPIKSWCTPAKRRSVTRQRNEWAREQTVREGPRYRELIGRRLVNEHLNRLAKQEHDMSRADGLGLDNMRIQAALTATAINLNKLLRWLDREPSVGNGPAGAVVGDDGNWKSGLRGGCWPQIRSARPLMTA